MKSLIEFVFSRIIGLMVHKTEKLTQKEKRAQEKFLAMLKVAPRKTKRPVIVALVGLVGSGKSFVARKLAETISATVVEGDKIRVCLRKEGERYEGARKIAENAVSEIIKGGNAVIDSDHINSAKRASLREKARQAGAKLIFVRTCADYDMMTGRAIAASYQKSEDDFFGGAGLKSKWQGDFGAATVKIREMWRRTPHHYRWVNKGGGKWVLKKLPFSVFAEIDTTGEKEALEKIQKTVARILKF